MPLYYLAPRGTLLNVSVITSTSIYIPTPGTNFILVELQGAGGGGGGCPATAAGQIAVGGGGNSGAYSTGLVLSAFSGVTVTIGAGGSGVIGGAGGNGGASLFGAIMSAGGGVGGAIGAGATSSPTIALASGSPATASGGSIANVNGSFGEYGESISGALNVGGKGADSRYGAGGYIGVNGGAATNANAYGAGGGGAGSAASTAAHAGGSGGNGVCIIYEYT